MTLAEHYGVPADERVEDTTWITDAASAGWIMFMKDERIRRRPAERQVLERSRARCFCLANGSLSSAEMATRYLDNWPRIKKIANQPGPYLYAVHRDRIHRLAMS